ncbi:hypothetical protein N7462_001042 [Penicillium macrosclerotiorum]|uniref:uncharacterized protein n=1 Tax=Penicillium macrosclerotiorum TaxID=303699 RepID=UPI002548597B|nr:uncharacterized protein N7462_001042 [Penicillium macrosclerotiorum]KAJ5699037.1 hypothetical protein N7462_001042 [Penicillium macrosclerotiorum]
MSALYESNSLMESRTLQTLQQSRWFPLDGLTLEAFAQPGTSSDDIDPLTPIVFYPPVDLLVGLNGLHYGLPDNASSAV